MSEFLCITGTDTDAGKTVVAAALARAAVERGLRVLLIKPIQTGNIAGADGQPEAPDLAIYREAVYDPLHGVIPGVTMRAISLFTAACSPHLAAQREGCLLTAAGIVRGIHNAVSSCSADLVLTEGAGGLFTPLNETETLCDVFALLGWPVLLTAANRLGTLNHLLLSLDAARSRGLPCPGFVMAATSAAGGELESDIQNDNPHIAAKLSGVPCLSKIPYLEGLHSSDAADRENAWKRAAHIVKPVLDMLSGPMITQSSADLLDFDREHVWHPYTSALAPLPTREAVATQGNRITLRDGRELIDGMASWWCAVHGYRHPALMAALREQAERMPHVMFGGLTHAPAVDLARKLLSMAPAGLEHVFFADSGSVAVEVALKMALQYQRTAGDSTRIKILALRGGYHGDTLGAMSVCDPENGMHSLFNGILPQQIFAPRPECRFDAPYDLSSEQALKAIFDQHGKSLAAMILEPIVQGAGGVWCYHPNYLRKAQELCRVHGCLLILDEIATGFGRTGKLFACEHGGVSPDILCLGKALTGGVMSLAATLATREVAVGISRNGGVLMHGPTFMANPLACAVSNASLDLLVDGSWKHEVARIETRLKLGLEPCRDARGVVDVRVLGAIGAIEMSSSVNVERLQTYFIDKHGVWIRPFNKTMYVMPPYMTPNQDVDTLTGAMHGAVKESKWN